MNINIDIKIFNGVNNFKKSKFILSINWKLSYINSWVGVE